MKYKNSPEKSLSAQNIDLSKTFPTQVLISSEQVKWNGLFARVFRHQPDLQLKVPAVAEEIVHIFLGNLTVVGGKIVKSYQPRVIKPGEIFILPKEVPTEWEWTIAPEFLQLCLSPTLIKEVAVEEEDIDPAGSELIEKFGVCEPFIQQLGYEILAELQSNGLLGRVYVETLTRALVMYLLRNHATTAPKKMRERRRGLSNRKLRQVQDYIKENLTKDLPLDEIAILTGLSSSHFAHEFKQVMQKPLHQYIVEQRVEAAKTQLLSGKMSIAQIAVNVGFHDQSHLHRHFKRLFGVTPRKMFENNRNVQKNRKFIQDNFSDSR